MGFLAALGSGIGSAASSAGGALASGAGAAGSALSSGASSLASGAGKAASALGNGASSLGGGIKNVAGGATGGGVPYEPAMVSETPTFGQQLKGVLSKAKDYSDYLPKGQGRQDPASQLYKPIEGQVEGKTSQFDDLMRYIKEPQ